MVGSAVGSSESALERGAVAGRGAFAAATSAFVVLVLVALAAADGGYFPTSWGWSALLFLWVATLALTLRSAVRLSRLELAFLGALAGLALCIGLSALWTSSPTLTLLELERVLVYLAAGAAGVLVARRSTVPALLAGTWAATSIVCLYSLATRLFPRSLGVFDPTAGYRLSEPVGYWNALGLFAAMGALLALGLVAHGRGALPPVAAASLAVTLPTVYFTFSRGAWIAFGIGLVAAFALDPRRLRLVTAAVTVGVWPALVVAVAYRSDALADVEASLEAAAEDGRRVALVLLVLAVVAAAAAVAFSVAAERVRVAPALRRGYALGLAAVAVVVLALVFARFGSPVTIVRDAYDAFRAPPQRIDDGNLRTRLFSLSGSGRHQQWRVAWTQAEENPWLGSGAGTFERYWVRDRPVAGVVRDAHSLYLETLAELGPLGLALLLAALGTPVVAAVLARGHPLVAGAFGAYVAFLAHAVVDWDWELPAVTLAALACAVGFLVAARDEERALWLGLRVRAGAAAVAVAVAVFAAVGLVGNTALASARDAIDDGDWVDARDDADRARGWAPWSAEPWLLLGKAQFGAGDRPAARASFEEAIAEDGSNWNLWFYLALASSGAARERALDEADRLNPLSPEVASLREDAGG